ncbi:exosortase-associated protein EpsI, B-type [Massilia sp. YIM B04103]|uniref:exosortase-associated protein EpsI, B-type n=1 Tax=Massilia sp. YIM B04103 TaxID=2963106 RepID=UPI00210A1257|nr:exosortase-associated protein EpsI, B-type [Massilia sp. YIM B04103]
MSQWNKALAVSLVAGSLMAGASALAVYLAPTARIADQRARIDLAAMVPESFGAWRVDTSIVPLQVDPETQARLDRIYNQTLARTYVNRDGQRVMLSIAYGGDQSSDLAVHLPETCYGAQGFEIRAAGAGSVATTFGAIPVKQLFAVSGPRQEPITYWITMGDRALQPGMSLRLQKLRYGLTGAVPDALLVRVSTLDGDTAAAYRLQAAFVRAMLDSMKPADRLRLVGAFPT